MSDGDEIQRLRLALVDMAMHMRPGDPFESDLRKLIDALPPHVPELGLSHMLPGLPMGLVVGAFWARRWYQDNAS